MKKLLFLLAIAVLSTSATKKMQTRTLSSGVVIQQMTAAEFNQMNFESPDCDGLVAAITVDAEFVEAHNGELTPCGYHQFVQLCTGPYAGEWVTSLNGYVNCPQVFEGAIVSEPICVDIWDVCEEW